MNETHYNRSDHDEIQALKKAIAAYARIKPGRVVYNLAKVGWTKKQICENALAYASGKPYNQSHLNRFYGADYQAGREAGGFDK